MSKEALDPYVRVATAAIETYVRDRQVISPPKALTLPMRERAGVFVSLKKRGELRGCIGTYLPTEETIAREVITNAIKSASADPRFPPVCEEELVELVVSVDVLSEPEPCDEEDLDPQRYGVIVESGWRRGLLLPDLPGVGTVSEQIEIARMKAGIGSAEQVRLYRFTVERHT